MTREEKELISTIKIAVIRGIVFADEEKLLELIKTAVGSNMSEKPTGSIHCQHTDAEIAKSFIVDVESVKDQLPCSNQMDFPDTFDEFAKEYGFKDKDEVYTNGSELITVFRVKQWLEHISTTKKDLAVEKIEVFGCPCVHFKCRK